MRSKWTKEKCLESALKCNERTEWARNDRGAYLAARNLDCFDECTQHMPKYKSERQKRRGWTLELCLNDAQRYLIASIWRAQSPAAYDAAYRCGWLEACSAHFMSRKEFNALRRGVRHALINIPLSECLKSALKFTSITKWKKRDKVSYIVARREGWLDACTKHMKKRRTATLEECQKSAFKFTSRAEWEREGQRFYNRAKYKGWLDLCCEHMQLKSKPRTLAECMESAKNFNSRKEWQKSDQASYAYAYKKGWVEKCSLHMTEKRFVWTKELCMAKAQEFETRSDFSVRAARCADTARKNGWYEECCKHMPKIKRKPMYTKEECKTVASRYMCVNDFRRNDQVMYRYVKRYAWLDEFFPLAKSNSLPESNEYA